jgi:hypothetical protein
MKQTVKEFIKSNNVDIYKERISIDIMGELFDIHEDDFFSYEVQEVLVSDKGAILVVK